MDSAAETGPGAVREQRYGGWKGWYGVAPWTAGDTTKPPAVRPSGACVPRRFDSRVRVSVSPSDIVVYGGFFQSVFVSQNRFFSYRVRPRLFPS